MPHPPRPIDGGNVAQTVVEYLGPRQQERIRGNRSGQSYRFDLKRQPVLYVLDEDLPHFRLLEGLFRVHSGVRIDPAERRLQAIVANATELGRAELASELEVLKSQLAELRCASAESPRSRTRTHGGRPRILDAVLQEMLHLAEHVEPRCSREQLAERFLGEEYAAPLAAVSQRLTRARRRLSGFGPETCSWCLDEFDKTSSL